MKQNPALKLNKSTLGMAPVYDGPFTPLDQTLMTPVHSEQSFFAGPKGGSVYANPQCNESDDILTDIDEPRDGFCSIKKYSLSFTPNFDKLLMAVYSSILSLPTTTPFLGVMPPSGLTSKVAHETMRQLLNLTEGSSYPQYDQQSIVNHDFLRNIQYQPIFLQMIRKRLIEICSLQGGEGNLTNKLPVSTTISINCDAPYSNNIKQTSISNLSLTDTNVANFNSTSSSNSVKSRSSSISLRKQSLTRHNSYSGNNWLHVGNLNNLRQHNYGNGTLESLNSSTDSLQSMQDFVPQSYINRSAGCTPSSSNNSYSPASGFNNMMSSYQTPPNSNKGSVSDASQSPNMTTNSGIQIVQNCSNSFPSNDVDYFSFINKASYSKTASTLPGPLAINTDGANYQALNALNGGKDAALDSPFMSAITPNEDIGFFSNAGGSGSISSASMLTERPTETYRDGELFNSSSTNIKKEALNLSQFNLSEKKRDSLKLKRGIL